MGAGRLVCSDYPGWNVRQGLQSARPDSLAREDKVTVGELQDFQSRRAQLARELREAADQLENADLSVPFGLENEPGIEAVVDRADDIADRLAQLRLELAMAPEGVMI